MKKIKLLTPILGIATITTAIAPIAGCSCNKTTEVVKFTPVVKDNTGIKVSVEQAILNDTLILNYEVEEGYEIDLDNSYIKVDDKAIDLSKHVYRVKDGKIYVQAIAITSTNVEINIVSKHFIHVKSVSLDKTASLAVGDTLTLVATLSPENATDKSITWTSTNVAIATVNNEGLITAKAEGTTEIVATTNDGSLTATCALTVNPAVVRSDFLTCEWSEIVTWSNNLEDGTITEAEFCDHFTNGKTRITKLEDFVGLLRTITINGEDHKVRVIGLKHDTLVTPAKQYTKALFTFEFFTEIRLTESKSSSTVSKKWNDDDYQSGTFCQYEDCSLQTYITSTLLPQFTFTPKAVTKEAATAVSGQAGVKATHTFNSQLWLPSIDELNLTLDEYGWEGLRQVTEGTVYDYYTDETHTAIKENVNVFWTRSVMGGGSLYPSYFFAIYGSPTQANAISVNQTYAFAPAFCL